MSFDYSKTLATSLRLVEKFGRQLTFVRLSEVSDNPSQPWLGTDDARTTPTATALVNGVFVHPESLRDLGYDRRFNEFIARSEQIAICAFDGDLTQFTEIVDTDGSRWKVEQMSVLQPGPTVVLQFAFVRR